MELSFNNLIGTCGILLLIERLKSAYLDGDFTSEEYRTEKQNIQLEQQTIEKRISEFSTDNKEVEITLEYLLKLVSKVNFLYESSRIDRKRKILNLVFSNFFLNGSNLSYYKVTTSLRKSDRVN